MLPFPFTLYGQAGRGGYKQLISHLLVSRACLGADDTRWLHCSICVWCLTTQCPGQCLDTNITFAEQAPINRLNCVSSLLATGSSEYPSVWLVPGRPLTIRGRIFSGKWSVTGDIRSSGADRMSCDQWPVSRLVSRELGCVGTNNRCQ